jgi:hypothetical protein
MPTLTPHTDRIECDELAHLAREFRATAERLHGMADAFCIAGRPTGFVRLRTRAWAYDEAARRCHEQLAASTDEADVPMA